MEAVHLTKVVPESNQRRYYRLHIEPGLFGDWGLVREWGRIGAGGQERTDWFTDIADAEQAQSALARQKCRRGYFATLRVRRNQTLWVR